MAARPRSDDYELPILHTRVPERAGSTAFWVGLGGAVVVGAVDLPLAATIAGAVAVARRRRRSA